MYRYYLAAVDEILDDGTCSVIFDKYGTTEVTQVCLVSCFLATREKMHYMQQNVKTCLKSKCYLMLMNAVFH